MADFENMVRLYFAGMGVRNVVTRASSGATHNADISGVLPVLAWRTLLSAKILNGAEPLNAAFVVDRQMLSLTCPGGIDVIDSQSCLRGLSWVLSEYEDGDMRGLDDLTTEIIREWDGELPVQGMVNAYLLAGYADVLDDWKAARSLKNDRTAEMGVERG